MGALWLIPLPRVTATPDVIVGLLIETPSSLKPAFFSLVPLFYLIILKNF